MCDTDHNLSFNAPEKNTAKGKEAKEFVESLSEQIEGEEITLFIPTKDGLILTDINSFDRIVGEIWVGDEKLTDILLKHGYGEYRKY